MDHRTKAGRVAAAQRDIRAAISEGYEVAAKRSGALDGGALIMGAVGEALERGLCALAAHLIGADDPPGGELATASKPEPKESA